MKDDDNNEVPEKEENPINNGGEGAQDEKEKKGENKIGFKDEENNEIKAGEKDGAGQEGEGENENNEDEESEEDSDENVEEDDDIGKGKDIKKKSGCGCPCLII